MSQLRQSLGFVLLVCLGLVACGHRNQPSETAETTGATETQPAGMTAEEAINLVRSQARSGALKTTVKKHYTETITKNVPCAQGAPTCEAIPPGGQFYFRRETRTEDHCCNVKQVPIPEGVPWRASKDENDNWRVEGDFTLEGEEHHTVFTIDRQTENVSELAP